MAMQCTPRSNELNDSQAAAPASEFAAPPVTTASPLWGKAEFDPNLLVIQPAIVCLDLEDLQCFEVVEHQFHHYGIAFHNAIALQPSNPAYPPRSGKTVLLGAPRSGWLEITFSRSISSFSCYVTSSQRLVLSAYDAQDRLITRASLAEPNLADSDSPIAPNALLKLEESNISRITLYAFDGQMTVDDISINL
jgi:hypothetical protein